MLRNIVLLLLVVGSLADDNDESINNYIKAILDNIKTQMPVGIPSLKIPVLEPLSIPNLNIDINQNAAKIKLKLDSTKVTGLSKFTTTSVAADLQHLKLNLKLNLHDIEAKSHYDVNGKVIIFPIYGNGRAFVKARNVQVGASAAITTNSEGYLQLNHFKMDPITFDKVDLLLENILGGGNLGNVVNTILNIMGKTIFDKFSKNISKELNSILLKEINKELRKFKLQDILAGALPTFSQSESMAYDAGTNSYVDQVLVNLRKEISKQKLDPLKIPDERAAFSKKILWVRVHGEAKLYNGLLHGLSTVKRIGDVKLETDGNRVIIAAKLGINGVRASFTGHAKFQGIGPKIRATASTSHAHINIKVSQDLANSKASPVLREFRIVSIGGINTKVHGLGPLGWVLGNIASVVVNAVKGDIIKAIEGPVRRELAKEISKAKIPL